MCSRDFSIPQRGIISLGYVVIAQYWKVQHVKSRVLGFWKPFSLIGYYSCEVKQIKIQHQFNNFGLLFLILGLSYPEWWAESRITSAGRPLIRLYNSGLQTQQWVTYRKALFIRTLWQNWVHSKHLVTQWNSNKVKKHGCVCFIFFLAHPVQRTLQESCSLTLHKQFTIFIFLLFAVFIHTLVGVVWLDSPSYLSSQSATRNQAGWLLRKHSMLQRVAIIKYWHSPIN